MEIRLASRRGLFVPVCQGLRLGLGISIWAARGSTAMIPMASSIAVFFIFVSIIKVYIYILMPASLMSMPGKWGHYTG
jgi:hypothetical protein